MDSISRSIARSAAEMVRLRASAGDAHLWNSVNSLVSTNSHLSFTYSLREETIRCSIAIRCCFSSASTPLFYSNDNHRRREFPELPSVGQPQTVSLQKSRQLLRIRSEEHTSELQSLR